LFLFAVIAKSMMIFSSWFCLLSFDVNFDG
jgi:hypothetical protein